MATEDKGLARAVAILALPTPATPPFGLAQDRPSRAKKSQSSKSAKAHSALPSK